MNGICPEGPKTGLRAFTQLPGIISISWPDVLELQPCTIAKKVLERSSHPWLERLEIKCLDGNGVDNDGWCPIWGIHGGVTGLCE